MLINRSYFIFSFSRAEVQTGDISVSISHEFIQYCYLQSFFDFSVYEFVLLCFKYVWFNIRHTSNSDIRYPVNLMKLLHGKTCHIFRIWSQNVQTKWIFFHNIISYLFDKEWDQTTGVICSQMIFDSLFTLRK